MFLLTIKPKKIFVKIEKVKRVDFKVDNMEDYAQLSLTRSCVTVNQNKKTKTDTEKKTSGLTKHISISYHLGWSSTSKLLLISAPL